MGDYEEYEDGSYGGGAGGSGGFGTTLNPQEVDQSLKLPIKSHVVKCDKLLEDLMVELEDSKRELQNLRNDIVSLGHINNESCTEVSRYVMDETIRLARDFRKLTAVEADETTFLKQQVAQLVQDRIRLQQNTLVLENRVSETEKDVGFKNMYD